MPEVVLAGLSTGTGNSPGVTDLGANLVAVTGSLPDGTKATVTVPAAVFDAVARAWVNGPKGTPWRLAVPDPGAGCVGDA